MIVFRDLHRNSLTRGEMDLIAAAANEITALREAAEFYARPAAYKGANARNDGSDRFTPKDDPYILGVERDGGATARKALGKE